MIRKIKMCYSLSITRMLSSKPLLGRVAFSCISLKGEMCLVQQSSMHSFTLAHSHFWPRFLEGFKSISGLNPWLSALMEWQVTNHIPQRILNVKSSPEVKGLSSSDRQEFKPELWCFLAMCLVGQLSLRMMKVKRLSQGRRTLMSITVRSAQYRLLETPLPGGSSAAPHHIFLFPFPLYPFLLFPLCSFLTHKNTDSFLIYHLYI